jgi:hypothetical protein
MDLPHLDREIETVEDLLAVDLNVQVPWLAAQVHGAQSDEFVSACKSTTGLRIGAFIAANA